MDRDELEDAKDELLDDNEDDLEYHITEWIHKSNLSDLKSDLG